MNKVQVLRKLHFLEQELLACRLQTEREAVLEVLAELFAFVQNLDEEVPPPKDKF